MEGRGSRRKTAYDEFKVIKDAEMQRECFPRCISTNAS